MAFQELRLTGSGGQGLILAGIILAEAALLDGMNVVQSQSYGPEARGGASKAEVIISKETINYPKVNDCDIMLALTQDACNKYIDSLKPGGILLVDSSIDVPTKSDVTIYSLPILETATNKMSNPIFANIIALGSIYELSQVVSMDALEKAVCGRVPPGTEELNRRALTEGFNLIKKHREKDNGDIS